MSNEKSAPAGEPQPEASQQQRPDTGSRTDSTSGQGAASAYARFRSQLEQRSQDGLQEAPGGRNL